MVAYTGLEAKNAKEVTTFTNCFASSLQEIRCYILDYFLPKIPISLDLDVISGV